MWIRWALVGAVTLGACGSPDSEKAVRPPAEASQPIAAAAIDAKPKAKERRVFEVKSSADLRALDTEYLRLWESGFDGTLEVAIAAGSYEPTGWQLSPRSHSAQKRPTIDVVLRGEPAALPPPSRVRARKLHVENLVWGYSPGPWELQVTESFTMKNSMMVDARGRKWDRAPYLAIQARGTEGVSKPTPVTARIESSWFLRNFQDQSPAIMIGFGSDRTAPGYWDSIEIDDCAFIGNAYSTSLLFEITRAATISRSLFYKPWAAGVLVKSTSSDSISIDESVIIADSLSNLAAHGSASPPIKLGAGTRVYVKDWSAGAALPATVVGDPAQLFDLALISAGEPELAAAAKLPADALPPAGLKAKLDAAAKP